MKELIIVPMELEDYLKVKPNNAWDYPLSEIPYLSETLNDGSRENNRFALINNRLFEL